MRWRWLEFVQFITSFLLHNKPGPILSNGVIFTRSLADPWDKVHSRDPDASNGQGMFPWLQQTLVGEEDCVTNQNNVCVGG